MSRSGARASVDRQALDGTELAVLQVGDVRAEVLGHGAHLVGLWWPDRAGRQDNAVVSLRRPDRSVDVGAYRDPVRNPHLGGMVGRYANRIASSRFELDGVVHRLPANEGPHHLHGGPTCFDRRSWSMATGADDEGAEVRLALVSDAGDQGHPGTVRAQVIYRLEPGVLRIVVTATTDAPTVVSITNHTYWNLAGTSDVARAATASVRDHELSVAADRVVRVGADLIPTGDLDPVEGSPFDLRSPRALGEVIDHPMLRAVGGLDHCLVLDGVQPCAQLADPTGGRRIRIHADQPGVQVYTANHGAGPLPRHGAVCLETQHLPDAPNRPAFPSAVLRPGSIYRHAHVVHLDALG